KSIAWSTKTHRSTCTTRIRRSASSRSSRPTTTRRRTTAITAPTAIGRIRTTAATITAAIVTAVTAATTAAAPAITGAADRNPVPASRRVHRHIRRRRVTATVVTATTDRERAHEDA